MGICWWPLLLFPLREGRAPLWWIIMSTAVDTPSEAFAWSTRMINDMTSPLRGCGCVERGCSRAASVVSCPRRSKPEGTAVNCGDRGSTVRMPGRSRSEDVRPRQLFPHVCAQAMERAVVPCRRPLILTARGRVQRFLRRSNAASPQAAAAVSRVAPTVMARLRRMARRISDAVGGGPSPRMGRSSTLPW